MTTYEFNLTEKVCSQCLKKDYCFPNGLCMNCHVKNMEARLRK
jgi:hypothetical protein